MSLNEAVTIGCVGMTHLGLVHAVAFAEKGFSVIGYDDELALVTRLQKHELPVNEPRLDELVTHNTSRLHFTNDLNQLKACDLIFIACDVPTDDQGNSNLTVIHHLIQQVTSVLSNSASLVILSQVPPGFTRQLNLPKDRLFYQVETLIFGRAVERALYPERYIVGTYDPNVELPKAYLTLLSSFDCPLLKMRYESAELAKISINMFLVSSVTTTNTLAEICENIGADWEEIAPALRLDKRIGPSAYLTPGLGIAGGNLERDLNTIIKLGQSKSTDTGVVHAWLKNSAYRRDWVLRCLQDHVFTSIKNPLISILGLAYKPDTHSIKNSPSIALIKQLKDYQLKTHDPVVNGESLTHATHYNDSIRAIQDADVVIIMTPWTDYQTISLELLKKYMRGRTVIDPYRVLPTSCRLGLNYFSLGQSDAAVEKKELDYA